MEKHMSPRAEKLRVAVQIDPLASLNAGSDSGLAIIEAGMARGHDIFCYSPESMALESLRLTALCSAPAPGKNGAAWHETGGKRQALDRFKLILVRQNPPYDMAYLTYAHMLRRLSGDITIINDPRALCDFPEKISPLLFPEFMPPTIVTRDIAALAAFAEQQGAVVLKPLYEFGGSGVIKISAGDIHGIETFVRAALCPVMAQKFLPQITQKGDRRIILIDGEIAGSIVRVPAEGSIIANMVRGGQPTAAQMSAREAEICAGLKPFLQKNGLFLAGIDVIDGYLTEINVTSPTGFRQIAALDNPRIGEIFWEKAEALVAERDARRYIPGV